MFEEVTISILSRLLFLHFANAAGKFLKPKKRRKNVLGSNGNDGVEVVLLIRTRALSYIYSLIFSSLYTHLNRKRDGGFCYLNARPFFSQLQCQIKKIQ